MEDRLTQLRRWSFSVFDLLFELNLEYKLCFSGGKDSHVLLGVYVEWARARGKRLNLKVVFSDTFLGLDKDSGTGYNFEQ